MNESSRGPILRIILHPATTIVFTVLGVAVGVVVIRNSAKEDSGIAYKNEAHIEEMRELNSLKSTVDGLATTVDGLKKRISAIEDRLPAPSKQRKTETTLTGTPNPSISGKAVTFSVVVSPAPPDHGKVNFTIGSRVLGTESLFDGSTTFTTSALPVGTNRITAVYIGEPGFSSSTSKVLKQVVMPFTR